MSVDKAYFDKKFDDLHARIEASDRRIADLSNEVGQLKINLDASRAEVGSLRRQLQAQTVETDNLEQYGRRMSVRIGWVPIVPGEKENPALLLAKINEQLVKVDNSLKLNPDDVVRFHRSGQPKTNNETGVTSAQCLVKLARWEKRRSLHGVNKRAREGQHPIRVYHDLTKRRLELMNGARDKLKSMGIASNDTFVYADVNSNLKLRANQRSFDFNTTNELDALIDQQLR